MNKLSKITLAGISIGLASTAGASITITSATYTTAVDNQYGFASFTAGGTTYSDFTIATTSDTNFGADGWNGGSSDTTGEPASGQAALNDAFITTNVFTFDTNIFDLGTTVNAGDNVVFYITEHIGQDSITVNPFDGSGQIGSWTLDLDDTDFGDLVDGTTTPSYSWDGSGSIAGTAFSLADFTGGSGTLTGVTRLEIVGNGDLDPSQVGVAAVPEPSTVALMAGLAGLGLVLYRRRQQQ